MKGDSRGAGADIERLVALRGLCAPEAQRDAALIPVVRRLNDQIMLLRFALGQRPTD
jgi:hypothetical protein